MASSRPFKLAKRAISGSRSAPTRLSVSAFSPALPRSSAPKCPAAIGFPFPPRSKIAVDTCNGASVELDGISEVEYVADETPTVSYVNVHAILDARRACTMAPRSSNVDSSQGPRVIVAGTTDSGKSSLCRMLLS
ncbi:unnamed protein product [Musa textilis]